MADDERFADIIDRYNTGSVTVEDAYAELSTFAANLGEEEERDDLVEVHVFATEPARANAEISRTVNLGDYESVRVQVGVSLPCYKEEIGPALEEASAIAGGFLDRELKGLGLKGLA